MKSLKRIDTEKYYGTNMIPVSEPNITEKELDYVTDAVKSTWISSTGKYIDRFESVFADYIGTKHALTVSNGTVALHAALLSLGIGPGDEVIVPALTYIATANAVTYTGATPVFTDSEPDTWNMCPDSIERLITQKTKAIIAVHLYGHPCDMGKINSVAKRNNLYVIEDAAEAIGSEYENKKVFAEIAKAIPPKLLVIADGPRADHPDDAGKCAAARAIIDRVDWDCEVLTNYSDVNMGCKRRVSSGLNWVFNTVEEAIILEDDCLPHPTFFRFCEELLEKYRDDERIAMISGDNFQLERKRTAHSYYFSRYTHIWGWASWRRAWENYDINMKLWPEIRDGDWLQDCLGDKKSARYWAKIFENTYNGKINSWGYTWIFACWVQGTLTILPNVNLVSNIGFGSEAVHTTEKNELAGMETEPMKFPISHPSYILRDSVADFITEKNNLSGRKLLKIVMFKIKSIFTRMNVLIYICI